MKRVNIHSWPLDMPSRGLESRFKRRREQYGPLAIVPASELAALVERASTVSRQLQLPFDLGGGRRGKALR